MQYVPEEWTESEERKRSDEGQTEQTEECETLMMELTQLVHMTVRDSSWWDRRGLDCTILASAFISLPIAFLLLSSPRVCYFMLSMVVMGVAHAVITVKGTHLASHGLLTESTTWTQFWNIFFIESHRPKRIYQMSHGVLNLFEEPTVGLDLQPLTH